jgi:hypothetical protein
MGKEKRSAESSDHVNLYGGKFGGSQISVDFEIALANVMEAHYSNSHWRDY